MLKQMSEVFELLKAKNMSSFDLNALNNYL